MFFLYLSCTNSNNENPSKPQDTSFIVEPFAQAPNRLQAIVDQEVIFDIQDSIGSSFEIFFGDGDSFSWSTDDNIEEIKHAYTEEGTFQGVLSAMGSDGSKDSQSIAVTVRNPQLEHPALFSAPMVNFEEQIFVAFEEGSHIIHISQERDVQFWETCLNPQGLAVQYDSTLRTYREQVGIVCDDGMFQIWSTNGQMISEIDLGTGSHPTAVIGRDGFWYIPTMGTKRLISVRSDMDGNILEQISVGEISDPKGITMNASGNMLYIPRFRSIDNEGKIYTFIADANFTWSQSENILLSPDDRGDSDNTTGGVPNLLQQIHISKDGENLHVAMTHANTLRGEFLNGLPLTHESTLRAVMSIGTLEEENNQFVEEVKDRKQLDEKGRIHQIISDAFDNYLYVLHEGAANISILDAHTYQLRGSVWDLGFAPHAMTFIPYTEPDELLIVYSWLSRSVIALDVSSNPPQEIWSLDLSDIDGWENVEVYNPQQLRGKQIFHDAKDTRITKSGYIACSHCHPNGDQDGLVWDFSDRGEGLRNTSSLLGRSGMAMGLLHWSGNFDEIQDFEGDIRNHFGGSGFLSDDDWQRTQDSLGEPKSGLSEDLDALDAYVSSLSQTPTSPFESSEHDIFEQYECNSCHPAPLYTTSTIEENMLYDIGSIADGSGQRLGDSLLGLDSPTLLGVVFTPPYLHNGSAPTIEEAILAHVNLSPISNEDFDILIQFVKSL